MYLELYPSHRTQERFSIIRVFIEGAESFTEQKLLGRLCFLYSTISGLAYEKVLGDLSKNVFSQNDVRTLCDAKDISRTFSEVDKISEAGYKIDKQSVALLRLYDRICKKVSGKEIDIGEMSTTEIKNLVKYSKAISKVGGITFAASALTTVIESALLIKDGKEDEAGKICVNMDIVCWVE